MTISPAATKENNYANELYPSIAAIASVYGDPDLKYATFLGQRDTQYAQEAYFLWNQPLTGGEKASAVVATMASKGSAPSPTGARPAATKDLNNASNSVTSSSVSWIQLIVTSVVLLAVPFIASVEL